MGGWGKSHILCKAFIDVLFLTYKNLANSKSSSRQSNDRCPWVCNICTAKYIVAYMRGLLRCSFLLDGYARTFVRGVRCRIVSDENHFYRSEEISDIGVFYFEVINENFFYYKNGEKNLLSLLSPVNNDRFEWACKEHRFFFVGESES